ncbi:hypothetical protein GBAR_LOCUS4611 [Geodia barretti]|uniref:Uncharacterized protein n=1 Tax=Geodia barretti TaxID=519541 RepID=A0AA35W3J5_GEOBA|nr:hypothetical protein GBAR_LOCUS4611 [Geodia barretti]
MAILDIWERSSSPPFTWNTLVSVLKSPSVNENALARELEHLQISSDIKHGRNLTMPFG